MHARSLLWVAAIAVLAYFPKCAAEENDAKKELAVHEWGTFTSVLGSDGVAMRFHPGPDGVEKRFRPDSDSPGFVHRAALKHYTLSCTVSLETTVIYFYTAQSHNVSVEVSFKHGEITRWFPRASVDPLLANGVFPEGEKIEWKSISLSPNAEQQFPVEAAARGPHYYVARETDAAPLQVPADGVHEQEKFLFYRWCAGGTFSQKAILKATGGDKFSVQNTSGHPIPAAFLVTVRNGEVNFLKVGRIDAVKTVTIETAASRTTVEQLGGILADALAQEGLFKKEAQAMVKTWQSAWLGETGTRLLYILPAEVVNDWLPMTIKPKPDALVRVMVGRLDIFTPEQEKEIEHLVKVSETASATAEEKGAAQRKISAYGRFSASAANRARRRP